jgi:hypothetical protein
MLKKEKSNVLVKITYKRKQGKNETTNPVCKAAKEFCIYAMGIKYNTVSQIHRQVWMGLTLDSKLVPETCSSLVKYIQEKVPEVKDLIVILRVVDPVENLGGDVKIYCEYTNIKPEEIDS